MIISILRSTLQAKVTRTEDGIINNIIIILGDFYGWLGNLLYQSLKVSDVSPRIQ